MKPGKGQSKALFEKFLQFVPVVDSSAFKYVGIDLYTIKVIGPNGVQYLFRYFKDSKWYVERLH